MQTNNSVGFSDDMDMVAADEENKAIHDSQQLETINTLGHYGEYKEEEGVCK